MAAKCNITGLLLDRITTTKYGVKTGDTNQAIIENYIEYLNCDDIQLETCYDRKCDNDPVVYNCFLVVKKINKPSFPILPADEVLFSLDNELNLPGFTYLWSYNTNLFDLLGNNTSSTLHLKVKAGHNLADIVSKVTVAVQDSAECLSVKSCYIAKGNMECGVAYNPCSNTSNLVVSADTTPCPAVSTLIVTTP